MSAHASFWNRVGSFFRHSSDSFFDTASAARNRENGAGRQPAPKPAPVALVERPAEPRPGTGLLRLMRSPARDAYERMGELMDGVQRHFDAQDRRAEQLAHSVERVATMLAALAETQRAQEACIRAITTQVESSGKFAASVSEAVGRMPASFQAQGEALRSIARQLEVLQESDGQLVLSLQKFGTAADALHASGIAQVQTLKELHESGRQQHYQTTATLREQNRRFMLVLMVTAGALVGVAACVAGFILQVGR